MNKPSDDNILMMAVKSYKTRGIKNILPASPDVIRAAKRFEEGCLNVGEKSEHSSSDYDHDASRKISR